MQRAATASGWAWAASFRPPRRELRGRPFRAAALPLAVAVSRVFLAGAPGVCAVPVPTAGPHRGSTFPASRPRSAPSCSRGSPLSRCANSFTATCWPRPRRPRRHHGGRALEIALARENLGALLSRQRLPLGAGFVYAGLAGGQFHPLVVLGVFLAITLLAFAAEKGDPGAGRGAMRVWNARTIRRATAARAAAARFILDLVGVAVFATTVLGLFFLYQGHEPSRIVVMNLLTAMLIVRTASAFSRPSSRRPSASGSRLRR